MVIFSALKRAAEKGAPCPGNAELGALVGCQKHAVCEAISKLAHQGKIRVEIRGSQRRVTIVETGRSTAPITYAPPPRYRPRPPVEVGELVNLAARIFDTTPKDIRSRAKFHHIVRSRQAVFCVASRLGWGASHIARALGVDHSSVHHARKNEDIYRREPLFSTGITALEAEVAKRAA